MIQLPQAKQIKQIHISTGGVDGIQFVDMDKMKVKAGHIRAPAAAATGTRHSTQYPAIRRCIVVECMHLSCIRHYYVIRNQGRGVL